MLEGIPGSGKGQMLTHLRERYQQGHAWRRGWEIDAGLTLGPAETPSAVAGLVALDDEFRRRNVWRRWSLPLLTPRFTLLRDELARIKPAPGNVTDTGGALMQWLVRTLGRLGWSASTGTPPLVMAPPAGPLVSLLRRLWLRLGRDEASRWVRGQLEALQRPFIGDAADRALQTHLEHGLIEAMAADLSAAGERRRFALRTAILFFDSFDEADAAACGWVLELSDELWKREAPVMLALSCGAQRAWSARVGEATYRMDGLVASDAVEIHTLGLLNEHDQELALMRHEVPKEMMKRLKEISRGHQFALDLLALCFGKGKFGGPRELEVLAKELRELKGGNVDDEEWLSTFCAAIAPRLERALDERLLRYARAAAVLRTFDERLLRKVLRNAGYFEVECYERLVATALVEGPRASALLATGEAYAIAPLLRDCWKQMGYDPEALREWHERALEHFEAEQAATSDLDRWFGLRAEVLHHRLYIDPKRGRAELVAAFEKELSAGRLNGCRMLIDVARDDNGPGTRDWRVEVETMAGDCYLREGAYALAEGSFRAAKDLSEGGSVELRLRVMQALASSLRLRARLVEAAHEVAHVLAHSRDQPVAHFQATWTSSLIEKERGNLDDADRLARRAWKQLEDLRLDDVGTQQEAAASFGLRDLPRKRAHLLRHRADIARRRGHYRESAGLLVEAESAYRDDPEPGAEALLSIVRAHLLRLKGQARAGEDLAERAHSVIVEETSSPRAELMAIRCIAQARLAGETPEQARDLFTQLATVDAHDYPVSVAVGNFGLGELARHALDYEGAHRHYRVAATPAVPDLHVFEHVYGQLGLVELHREQGQARLASELLRSIDDELLRQHPLLSFWGHLLGARAQYAGANTNRGRAGARGRGRRSRARWMLTRAQRALKRIEISDGRHLPQQVYDATDAAFSNGRELNPVMLLLP